MKKTVLDEEEKDILDSYERGEWKPVKNPKHHPSFRRAVCGEQNGQHADG